MTFSQPRQWPVAVAVGVTTLLGIVFSVAQGGQGVSPVLLGALGFLSLVMPFLLPAFWVWAVLMVSEKRAIPKTVVLAASLWLVVGWWLFPADVVWPLATQVATGLAIGWGLSVRLKPELIILAMVLVSVPVLVWSFQSESLEEVFHDLQEQTLQTRRDLLMTGVREGTEPPTLAQEKLLLDDMFQVVRKVLPGTMVLVQLVQSGLAFWLIWFLLRVWGLNSDLKGPGSFGRWRWPFGVVWLLAAGIGLMIIKPVIWPEAGVNLVLVVVGLLALQGAAVHWRLSAVTFPLLARVFFMFVAVVVFLPLVLLGLADQWLDFRKLNQEDPVNGGVG